MIKMMDITDALALVLAEQQGLTKLDAYERRDAHMALVRHVHETRTKACFEQIASARDRINSAIDRGNREGAVSQEHVLRYAARIGQEIDASLFAARAEIDRRFRAECSTTRAAYAVCAAYAVSQVDIPNTTGFLVGAACEMPTSFVSQAPAITNSSPEIGSA